MEKIQSTPIGERNFINPKEISPFVTKFDIKVLYLGKNPNKGYISRKTAIKMAGSLRGSCIVGKYDNYKQDFMDHEATRVRVGNDFEYVYDTRPYGFIDINAKLWFQDFEEDSYEGGKEIRTYLCTEGYIWTGVYPESKRMLEGENNQSLQFYKNSIKGEWAKDKKTGDKYYIYNDGKISSLCILGEDVLPGFEGAKFDPAANFSLNTEEIKRCNEDVIVNFSLAIQEEIKKGMSNMENENIIVDNKEKIEEITDEEIKAVEESETAEENIVEEKSEITEETTATEESDEVEEIAVEKVETEEENIEILDKVEGSEEQGPTEETEEETEEETVEETVEEVVEEVIEEVVEEVEEAVEEVEEETPSVDFSIEEEKSETESEESDPDKTKESVLEVQAEEDENTSSKVGSSITITKDGTVSIQREENSQYDAKIVAQSFEEFKLVVNEKLSAMENKIDNLIALLSPLTELQKEENVKTIFSLDNKEEKTTGDNEETMNDKLGILTYSAVEASKEQEKEIELPGFMKEILENRKKFSN